MLARFTRPQRVDARQGAGPEFGGRALRIKRPTARQGFRHPSRGRTASSSKRPALSPKEAVVMRSVCELFRFDADSVVRPSVAAVAAKHFETDHV